MPALTYHNNSTYIQGNILLNEWSISEQIHPEIFLISKNCIKKTKLSDAYIAYTNDDIEFKIFIWGGWNFGFIVFL